MLVGGWIRTAANELGIVLSELSDETVRTLLQRIEMRFASPGDAQPLWERLRSGLSIQDSSSWRWVGGLISGPATLFAPDGSRTIGFRIASCVDIEALLAECPGFVFYLSDETCQELVAVNDHDVLIACGRAVGRLRSVLSDNGQLGQAQWFD